jgi:outer membrane protein assembly factor BamA
VALSTGVSYISNRAGSGTDPRYPSAEQVFSPSTLAGFDNAPDYIRTDVGAAYDWRDNPMHPHDGGRYSVRFADYRDQNRDAYSFQRVDVDVHQYVPLPDRYRTLAFRAIATFTDAATGHEVPFFEQPTLGGSQVLRGFREFRFRDQNSVAMTAEYRWEAWWALDGALFVDAGTVASNWRGLRLNEVDVTYGFGFRVHSNSAFAARLDFAFSREGFIPLLRFEHVF